MALWNNVDTQAGKPKWLGLGQLKVINVSGTMSGYSSGSFTIAAPPAGGVQAVATYVAVAGVITTVTITNPGAGYVTAPAVTAAAGSGAVLAAVLQPKAPHTYAPNSNIVFIDRTEAAVPANRAKGLKTPGWNMYTEYVDNNGATRHKVSTLVAMSKTAAAAGDNTDDTIAGDVNYVIGTQPTDVSVISGVATAFSVVAATPSAYQWQMRPAAGGQYANLTNAGVYTTVTTATLNISDANGLTGNHYRCIVLNSAGTASATSTGAKLTSVFGIVTQPTAKSVTAPAGTTFAVAAANVTSYIWQVKVGAAAYVAVVASAIYTGVTTATLTVTDSTGLNGNLYRCVITDGTTTVTSTGVALTVA